MKLTNLPLTLLFTSYFTTYDFSLTSKDLTDHTPYFISSKPMTINGLTLPSGTRLEYKKSFFRKNRQRFMPHRKHLTGMILPEDTTIIWGSVPVSKIYTSFRTEMNGFTIFPDFGAPLTEAPTPFYRKWKEEGSKLGILVKNKDDWSFNKENIIDINSCGINNNRLYRGYDSQQNLLDKMYALLMNVN